MNFPWGQSQQGLASGGGSAGGIDNQADVLSGIMEEMEPEIRIIPNPASDQTQIKYRFDGGESLRTIEIYDMTGRSISILQPQNNAGIVTLQLGDFVGGIYQICLRQGGHIVAQSKLSVTP